MLQRYETLESLAIIAERICLTCGRTGAGQNDFYASPGICKMSRGQELLQLSDLQDVLETAAWQICKIEWNSNLLYVDNA